MPAYNRFRYAFHAFLMTAATLALVSCSTDDDRYLNDLDAPARVDVLSPPIAPDPNSMHPALQIAKSRGLKTNVYFNEELQQAVSRLSGMEETLGRLQSDLQGTAMAMQRVEMMRQEVEALNLRFQSLQERLVYAGPVIAPEMQHADVVEQTSLQGPTPLMGEMAAPTTPEPVQAKMEPVVDERPAAAPAPTLGAGVNGARIGTHADRVRVVLDVTGSETGFSANVDNTEKLLTIELPKAKWVGAKSETLKGNPVIASYAAQGNGGAGSIAAFTLKGTTKILEMKTYKGSGNTPTRLVVDLAK